MCFLNFKNCLILNPLFMNVNLDRHIFELCQRDQQRVILKCETMQEKNDWMAALVMLNTKSMLERTLDVILSDEENKHPLHLPDSKLYKYYYYCCYSFIPRHIFNPPQWPNLRTRRSKLYKSCQNGTSFRVTI